jgi:hypothetical protein
MNRFKTVSEFDKHYHPLGADVIGYESSTDGYLIPVTFQCMGCGLVFRPPADRTRNRHRCPNKCGRATKGDAK